MTSGTSITPPAGSPPPPAVPPGPTAPPSGPPTILTPTAAGAAATAPFSALVVKYPFEVDTAPAIAGDLSSPVTALWHNYLALLIEAVEAELGPLDLDSLGTPTNLMNWLGNEIVGSQVSNWRTQTKTSGGDAAGQVYGLHKRVVSGTGAFYAITNTTTFNAFQGAHPLGKSPVTYCTPSGWGHGTAIFTGPAIVRGVVTGFASGFYNVSYRGNNGLAAGGNPAGAGTFATDILLLYMVEAF